MFDSLVLVFVHSRHSPMGRRGVQRNVEPFFMVAQLNSSAGSHKGVLIGRYTSYIFEIIDSNIILRCLRRSRQHQSFELRCHLFLMSSPPLSWRCQVKQPKREIGSELTIRSAYNLCPDATHPGAQNVT